MNEKRVCCFTGHRKIQPMHKERLSKALEESIVRLIDEGFCVFRAGGALGFDTVAALKVLELKKKYPHISLELCLPCKNQASMWSEYCKRVYEYILTRADGVSYVSESYTRECMMARNRRLVDGSSACIAYCEEKYGGTAYTVEYARSRGVRVINIAEIIK